MQSRVTIILLILCIGVNIVCDDYDRSAAGAEILLRGKSTYIKTALISELLPYTLPRCGCVAVSLYNYFNDTELNPETQAETKQYRDRVGKSYVPQMKTTQMNFQQLEAVWALY